MCYEQNVARSASQAMPSLSATRRPQDVAPLHVEPAPCDHKFVGHERTQSKLLGLRQERSAVERVRMAKVIAEGCCYGIGLTNLRFRRGLSHGDMAVRLCISRHVEQRRPT